MQNDWTQSLSIWMFQIDQSGRRASQGTNWNAQASQSKARSHRHPEEAHWALD